MKDESFDKWMTELEEKLLSFQIHSFVDKTRDQYVMHRNCVRYDHEVYRLSKFNNFCKNCNLPLHLTNNFEIAGLGPVCTLCYTMHSIVTEYDRRKREENRYRVGH